MSSFPPGRIVIKSESYTYTADQFFAPDNLVIEENRDEDGNVSYIYYQVNQETGERTVWMRPLLDIINVQTAVFSLDTVNTNYNVSYWYSYTPEDGDMVICTERYTTPGKPRYAYAHRRLCSVCIRRQCCHRSILSAEKLLYTRIG